ncbi:MAG: preprotein translocase subunit SecE [Gloeocapsa sp. DLM2.Bin57]|nr:MAG: preprotein translocase subunit SecE [Gloeocapsa sp. DLM2.Bin57]
MAKKETASQEKAELKEQKTGTEIVSFVKATRQELTKVVWPSRQQLISESVAVILMVILVATVIYLVDNLFSWAALKVF